MFKKKHQRAPVNNFQLQILRLLRYRPMYGYEILNIFDQKGWKPSTGTLYPALRQLEKKEFIKSYKSNDQIRGANPRTNYKLTKKGFDYVQTTFNINIRHPELYIEPFADIRDSNLIEVFRAKALVLDFLNFINPENVFKTMFPRRIPTNIEFKKVYDFNLENPKPQLYDYIVLFIPFSFTFQDFYSNPARNHLKILKDVKLALKPDGSILIIDIEWTKHALVDILSFMATGEVMEMAYTEDQIKTLLSNSGYININTLQKQRGIMIIMADNKSN